MYINNEKVIINFYESLKRDIDLVKEQNLINADYFLLTIRIDTVEKLMDELEIKYEKRKI